MSFWGVIGRMLLVPLAVIIAAIVSFYVLFTLGAERFTHYMHERGSEADQLSSIFEIIFGVHLLASGLTVLPALLLVIIGEVARIRSFIYYIVGGGVVAALIPLVGMFGSSTTEQMPSIVVFQVFATAGFAGGLVYWLIAGRSA